MTTSEDVQRTPAFAKAVALYDKTPFPQTNLLTDIIEYATNYYAYCSPTCIILAKVIEGRGWFIYLAVGDEGLTKFFTLAPFPLEFIGFARPGRGRDDVRWYQWKVLYDHCHKKR